MTRPDRPKQRSSGDQCCETEAIPQRLFKRLSATELQYIDRSVRTMHSTYHSTFVQPTQYYLRPVKFEMEHDGQSFHLSGEGLIIIRALSRFMSDTQAPHVVRPSKPQNWRTVPVSPCFAGLHNISERELPPTATPSTSILRY